MDLVTFAEFMQLTRLAPEDVLTMLHNGELTLKSTEEGGMRIDISLLTPEMLANRSRPGTTDLDEADSALLEETIASEIVAQFSSIIEDALSLALRWTQARP